MASMVRAPEWERYACCYLSLSLSHIYIYIFLYVLYTYGVCVVYMCRSIICLSCTIYHRPYQTYHPVYIINLTHRTSYVCGMYLFTCLLIERTREIERESVCVCARMRVFPWRGIRFFVCLFASAHWHQAQISQYDGLCFACSWLFRFKMKHVEKACNRPVTDLPDKVILISLTSELNPKTCPYTVLNPNRST